MLHKHVSQQKSQESGFTLVELLVVIVIIGLLAAIAIPIFMNQRQKANDTALISDLHNVAATYQTWHSGHGNSNAKLRQLSGGDHQINITADDAIVDEGGFEWDDVPGLPTVSISSGSRIDMLVYTSHREGEFCLVGMNAFSQWDYVSGMGDHSKYDDILYYDPMAGGIITIEELAEIYEDDQETACTDYARRWLVATQPTD